MPQVRLAAVAHGGPAAGAGPRPGRRVYGEVVRTALLVVRKASDRVCGKRLQAILSVLVEAMERHGHLALDAEVRRLLAYADGKPRRDGVRAFLGARNVAPPEGSPDDQPGIETV